MKTHYIAEGEPRQMKAFPGAVSGLVIVVSGRMMFDLSIAEARALAAALIAAAAETEIAGAA